MFRLNVLNPGGRDPEQHFGEAAGANAAPHAPVNFHAYAACTGGVFFRETTHAIVARSPVVLLLRGDFRDSERALNFLKKARMTVAVSLKETGLHQIANQLADASNLRRFLRIVEQADGCLAPTREAAEIYRTIRGDDTRVAFIPTPYPLHDPAWDVSSPMEERRGIFVGTREWDVPSRNHLAALLAARRMSDATGEPVTVHNRDGRKGERLLATLGFPANRLGVIKRLDYPAYLRVVAQHKIVFQLDTSFVPGQVAGDALLGRMPCVGGNGAIERIAFPELCGSERAMGELIETATRLLRDARCYEDAVAASQKQATERLSFPAIAAELEQFFEQLRRAM